MKTASKELQHLQAISRYIYDYQSDCHTCGEEDFEGKCIGCTLATLEDLANEIDLGAEMEDRQLRRISLKIAMLFSGITGRSIVLN